MFSIAPAAREKGWRSNLNATLYCNLPAKVWRSGRPSRGGHGVVLRFT